MGSAFGAAWRPSPTKPHDQRFLGNPGEIKITYTKKGDRYETKIGDDGKATSERHNTDHNRPDKHTNPHDHKINWQHPKPGIPNFEKPHINDPDVVPELKQVRGGIMVKKMIQGDTFEQDGFITISDFIDCMIRGGEVEFIWRGKPYSITHPDGKTSICQGGHYSEAVDVDEAEELLDCFLGQDKLRDVITQVEVLYRTI